MALIEQDPGIVSSTTTPEVQGCVAADISQVAETVGKKIMPISARVTCESLEKQARIDALDRRLGIVYAREDGTLLDPSAI